jgi:RNA polymerase sigma-70 factor (ECF subfamily)
MIRDDRLLARLAEQHGPRILAYLARRTEDPDDAADVFQAVLLVAWKRMRVIPDDEHAALAWLLATARRCLANHRRGHARRLAATDRLKATIHIPAPEPPDERQIALGQAVTKLSESDQELLRLVYWDDLTTDQAAAVIGVEHAAARKRLERARSRLRANLKSEASSVRERA